MAIREHIRHPIEWGADQVRTANVAVERASHSLRSPAVTTDGALPAVRRIEFADLKEVLVAGCVISEPTGPT